MIRIPVEKQLESLIDFTLFLSIENKQFYLNMDYS